MSEFLKILYWKFQFGTLVVLLIDKRNLSFFTIRKEFNKSQEKLILYLNFKYKLSPNPGTMTSNFDPQGALRGFKGCVLSVNHDFMKHPFSWH